MYAVKQITFREMLSSIELRCGRAPGQPSEPVSLTPITVFVGPNNSGKSRVLAELAQYCRSGQQNAAALVLKRAEFAGMNAEFANEAIDKIRLTPQLGEAVNPTNILVGARGSRMQVPEARLRELVVEPSKDPGGYAGWFLQHLTLMLDGSNRITLTNQQPAGDLQAPAHTSFQQLFRDDARRCDLRKVTSEAFGYHLVIDPTNLGSLRLRLSSRPPSDLTEERGIDDRAVKFHASALSIDQASDGVKAFTGIMAEVVAGDPRVIIIDEPEAFLHPALAYKLGLEVSRATAGAAKQLFAATHSPQFVMGCVQSGVPVNIIRLTYRGGLATARLLPSADLIRLMRNPLLRSTGVLGALFYEFVIITEADSDRAFYNEVNERLLRVADDAGIPNGLFINAQNKQTLHQIMRPLRDLGIPAAAIVDVDVVKEGGTVFTSLLGGAAVPTPSHQALGTLRATVKSLLDASGKDMKRDGGVDLLAGQARDTAYGLFDQLAAYGLFTVRRGELESWLKNLGAAGKGPSWLTEIFEKMGEDPTVPGYVAPGAGDVWEFVRTIRTWLVDPQRKGIPV